MLRTFHIFSQITLVLVFMIVMAGSIVRATGSGMGCPDWPKCFGKLIPPTSVDQVTWAPGKEFNEGEMIVFEDALWTAKSDVIAGEEFNLDAWEKYTKHDYAIYNPMHTWIEFLNRLLAPTSGVPAAIMLGLSILLWIRQKRLDLFLISLGVILFMGFEAWLGKIVVDGNLVPGHITMHMFGTFFILALLLMNVYRSRQSTDHTIVTPRFKNVILLTLVLLLFQTFMGTQVREDVDALLAADLSRSLLIENVSFWFYIHRSFSLVLLALIAWTVHINRKNFRLKWVNVLGVVVLLEILAGVILSYFDMPAWLQPVHLWLNVLMFMTLSWILVVTRRSLASAIPASTS